MALAASTIFELRTTGLDTNSGGFNPGNTSFPTDLAATSGTGASPVVTSASYTFVAGDVGSALFVKAGTNWVPGWYPIASVSAGAATLTASIGSVLLYGGATRLNTATGVATTASPTGGTWGIDHSQRDTPRYSFTDLVIGAGANNNQFTSAANPVNKGMVGNLVNVASGTGFTVQTVEVVSTATTTATADKVMGTASSTGGVGKLGGCYLTPAKLAANQIGSNKAFVKSGTYTSASAVVFGAANVTPTATVPYTRLIGYASVRGDITPTTSNQASRPQILVTSAATTAIQFSNNGWFVENIVAGGSGVTCSSALYCPSNYVTFLNCKATAFANNGIIGNAGSYVQVVGCEVTGGTAGIGINVANFSMVTGCWSHDHTGSCKGISTGAGATVVGNLVSNCAGASATGIETTGPSFVLNNTVYKSGGAGISATSSNLLAMTIRNNLITECTGWGIDFTTAALPATPMWDGNAFYSNTAGNRHNLDDTATNVVDAVVPYINTLDVILSADPFQAKASDDYRLNTTAGGGAACRAHGVPNSWPGNSLTVAAHDVGAVQHADPAGGGGLANYLS
jgi:hypothetical protein